MADTRNMGIWLGAAFFGAILFGFYVAISWGPSGTLPLKNSLIDPLVLQSLNYNGMNTLTHESDRFIFDRILFTYEGEEIEVPIEAYQKIYDLLAKDVSSKKNEDLFQKGKVAKLELFVKTESTEAWRAESKIFQEMEIGEEGYRVNLPVEGARTEWLYFTHPAIFKAIYAIIHSSTWDRSLTGSSRR